MIAVSIIEYQCRGLLVTRCMIAIPGKKPTRG